MWQTSSENEFHASLNMCRHWLSRTTRGPEHCQHCKPMVPPLSPPSSAASPKDPRSSRNVLVLDAWKLSRGFGCVGVPAKTAVTRSVDIRPSHLLICNSVCVCWLHACVFRMKSPSFGWRSQRLDVNRSSCGTCLERQSASFKWRSSSSCSLVRARRRVFHEVRRDEGHRPWTGVTIVAQDLFITRYCARRGGPCHLAHMTLLLSSSSRLPDDRGEYN